MLSDMPLNLNVKCISSLWLFIFFSKIFVHLNRKQLWSFLGHLQAICISFIFSLRSDYWSNFSPIFSNKVPAVWLQIKSVSKPHGIKCFCKCKFCFVLTEYLCTVWDGFSKNKIIYAKFTDRFFSLSFNH